MFCDFTNGGATDASISNIDGAARNIARGNKGFVTENNVLFFDDDKKVDFSTIGIKEIKIPHGLDYTPELYECQVTVIVNDAAYTGGLGSIWVRSSDSTHITVMVEVVTSISISNENVQLALHINRFAH